MANINHVNIKAQPEGMKRDFKMGCLISFTYPPSYVEIFPRSRHTLFCREEPSWPQWVSSSLG